MDITSRCVIAGKHGFDIADSNKFVMIEVEGRNGDSIKVNRINGFSYKEIWAVCERPDHDEHPAFIDSSKTVMLGGKEGKSRRLLCILGK